MSLTRIGKGLIQLSWTGGEPPFRVWGSSDLRQWNPLAITAQREMSFVANGALSFFRVEPQVLIIINDSRFSAQNFTAWKDTLRIEQRNVDSNSCEITEGCIGQAGVRKLLEFVITIANLGNANVALPTIEQRPDLFYFSPCHNHYHLKYFSKFLLMTADGVAAQGEKLGWCLESNDVFPGPASTQLAGFNCTHPGLDWGWGDTYGYLSCMWLDITGVPDGDYTVSVTIDPQSIYGIGMSVSQVIRLQGLTVITL